MHNLIGWNHHHWQEAKSKCQKCIFICNSNIVWKCKSANHKYVWYLSHMLPPIFLHLMLVNTVSSSAKDGLIPISTHLQPFSASPICPFCSSVNHFFVRSTWLSSSSFSWPVVGVSLRQQFAATVSLDSDGSGFLRLLRWHLHLYYRQNIIWSVSCTTARTRRKGSV